jgi:hypothetical protein
VIKLPAAVPAGDPADWPLEAHRAAMSTRLYHALTLDKHKTLRDVAAQTEGAIWRMPNVGKRTVKELKQLLAEHGLSLAKMPQMTVQGVSVQRRTLLRAIDDAVSASDSPVLTYPTAEGFFKRLLAMHGMKMVDNPDYQTPPPEAAISARLEKIEAALVDLQGRHTIADHLRKAAVEWSSARTKGQRKKLRAAETELERSIHLFDGLRDQPQ